MSLKKQKKFDQINVIPFIDIMLVLLVMVLTTATFIKQGVIPVTLPKATSSEEKVDKKEIDIFIKKDGSVYIDKDKVSLSALEDRLAQIPKEQSVILRSDKEADFQYFVMVMDTLKKFEHEQLFIVTTNH